MVLVSEVTISLEFINGSKVTNVELLLDEISILSTNEDLYETSFTMEYEIIINFTPNMILEFDCQYLLNGDECSYKFSINLPNYYQRKYHYKR